MSVSVAQKKRPPIDRYRSSHGTELIWGCAPRSAPVGPTARGGAPVGASRPSTPPELPSPVAGVSVPDPDLDQLAR